MYWFNNRCIYFDFWHARGSNLSMKNWRKHQQFFLMNFGFTIHEFVFFVGGDYYLLYLKVKCLCFISVNRGKFGSWRNRQRWRLLIILISLFTRKNSFTDVLKIENCGFRKKKMMKRTKNNWTSGNIHSEKKKRIREWKIRFNFQFVCFLRNLNSIFTFYI